MPRSVGAGYYYNSNLLDFLFEGLAIGATLYGVLPNVRLAFRPAATPDSSALQLSRSSPGVLLGFLIGFAVNAF
ncbi:MAG: hypothetical protein L3K13_06640 [Thermoplasmata archaeon]|nr:hypothetical protein [Thermoplasmata archaeon]